MADTHPADLTLRAAADRLRRGRLSAADLTDACLERIDARDARYGGWLHVYRAQARQAARDSDARHRVGDRLGPLDGVPIGLKDVIGAAGHPLTGDSVALTGNLATQDAGAWARLRAAGMVLLGHLHCGEFACGTWGRNPWHPDFSPGGSSSGSGVALATRTVPATLGTDTRGSIRNPCAQNGVTGVKPSFGMVSARGIIPLAVSYDVVGPMARTAADCATLLGALAELPGLPWPAGPRSGARPVAGARIGVPRLGGLLSDGVGEVFDRFSRELTALGAVPVPIERPANPLEADGGWGGYRAIIGAEARAMHAQFADRQLLLRREFRDDFPPLLDPAATAADYVDAQRQRVELADRWRDIVEAGDLQAIAEPCATGEIWRAGASPRDPSAPPRLYGMWSDTNFPVVCLPAGRSPVDSGPVGVQLIGLPHTEPMLLQLAIDYQAATGYHLSEPPGLDDHTAPDYVGPDRPAAGPQPPLRVPVDPFDIRYGVGGRP